MSQGIVRRGIVMVAALVWSAGFGPAALANLVPEGRYQLHSHPDGNQFPPAYGFRLDGLDGISNHRFTFDFDYTDGARSAGMFLDLDRSAGTIHIYGSMYGGLNDPSNTAVYDNLANGTVGWWNVDFTYRTNVTSFVGGDGFGLDDTFVSAPDEANSGLLTRDFVSSSLDSVYDLTDFSRGGTSFRFGDDSAGPGHRGFDGISGWGWVNHSGFTDSNGNYRHVYSSDWLFTANPVPVPGAVVLAAVGLGALGITRRRRSSWGSDS